MSTENNAASAGTHAVEASATQRSFFEIVRGNPTPEQVGILTALFATAEGNAAIAARNPVSTEPRDSWGSAPSRVRGVFWKSTNSFLDEKFL
ncbi:acyl-CoA carboxylase subunit epsilon [Dietzia sp.]|uniref:acyl-CoA carboxylase subunit epsilon n=1 Tax=Dietzia sp. TaxID=1871616 RepID=UPI002FDA5D2C